MCRLNEKFLLYSFIYCFPDFWCSAESRASYNFVRIRFFINQIIIVIIYLNKYVVYYLMILRIEQNWYALIFLNICFVHCTGIYYMFLIYHNSLISSWPKTNNLAKVICKRIFYNFNIHFTWISNTNQADACIVNKKKDEVT